MTLKYIWRHDGVFFRTHCPSIQFSVKIRSELSQSRAPEVFCVELCEDFVLNYVKRCEQVLI